MAALNDLRAGWLVRHLLHDLRTNLASWRDELRGNPRLWGGAAVVALLAWGGAAGMLQDYVSESRERLDVVADRYRRVRAVAVEIDWPQRRGEAETLRRAVEGRLWPRQTEGLATAGIQDWVMRKAGEAGLAVSELRAGRPGLVPGMSDLWAIEVRLVAPFASPALEQFLAAVGGDERLVTVRSMRVQQEPEPRVELTLATFLPADSTFKPRISEAR